ncbi:gpi ethanolamine phosphate transferase 1 [Quercus suber]|uniref:GPI ethanolamine phosphate transferase 1 n=1 Tax=Quercus suber TaxID=58331 RepID=A0AAW0LWE7_QUESU
MLILLNINCYHPQFHSMLCQITIGYADASFLDEWSFDQFQSLLNRSNEDSKLKELLLQDNLVIFLHLLGCDSNGHAHRPFSSIYLNNVKVVDSIAERVYHMVEDHFKDSRTAYIFTADHGMSDKGSHGDGHPSNTDTPLVAWGAGVKNPKRISSTNHSHCNFRFVDEHMHDAPTPVEWGLNEIERVDVNQADIAPLMVSTLVGLPCPVNSVGSLPLDYVNMIEIEEVEAVVSNTKQILNQFLRKSHIKQSNSLYFKPFKQLANYSAVLDQIERLISFRNYEAAMKLSENLRSLALQGLHYFQTYDWLMLMTIITLGYIGWMIYLFLHVLQSYTSLPGNISRKEQAARQRSYTGKINLCGCLFMGALSILLFLEHSPPLYHAYTTMTVFLWTRIINEYWSIRALWIYLRGRKFNYIIKLVATSAVALFILELLVNSFTDRKLYTWCFLIMGAIASLYLLKSIPWRSGIPIFVCIACWFLSIFTLMPAQIPDNNQLVIASGAMIILIGLVARWLDLHAEGNKFWLSISNHGVKRPKFPMLFHLQALLVGLSSVMVSLSTSHRTEKQELLALHQLINWSIAGFSMVLPLFSANGLLSRLTSIFLGFAPPFLLLSIGYEAVFYGALALVLMAWILFENTVLYLSKVKKPSSSIKIVEDHLTLDHDTRCLQLSDVRIPLIFMVLFNVAFFGTGNFASIASFEISSVYRFITVFSPFLMAALLVFKLFIPFLLVMFFDGSPIIFSKWPLVSAYFYISRFCTSVPSSVYWVYLIYKYEAVFYGALALVLMAWILFENTVLYLSKVKKPSSSIKIVEDHLTLDHDTRCLQLSDVRIHLIFMVLFNVAFFGTGNFASIASFEISSVYRFITVFSMCFQFHNQTTPIPRLGCYFLVISFSDVMTFHFFFLVRNTGSWMEIGNSISHFGIVSAQVVFVLLLFALTNVYTKDIQCNSALESSQKAM